MKKETSEQVGDGSEDEKEFQDDALGRGFSFGNGSKKRSSLMVKVRLVTLKKKRLANKREDVLPVGLLWKAEVPRRNQVQDHRNER